MIALEKVKILLNEFENIAPILVVGDVGLDKYTLGEVSRISPEAPVPVLQVKSEFHKLAMASNISHNLKELSVRSTILGLIGNDQNAALFEGLLKSLDLSTEGVIKSGGRGTILKERITTSMQQICRVDYEQIIPVTVDEEERIINKYISLLQTHSALIIEDYAKGMLTQSVLKKIIHEAKLLKKIIAVDPGRTTPPEYYHGVTLLKPNLAEAKIMVNRLGYHDDSVEKMCEVLLDKLSLSQVVITLGKEGMALMDKEVGVLKRIPTMATEVFDVSGAGDTTISLIIASLVAGATLEEASWMGNLGAGVVVGKRGTATVNSTELLDHYERFHRYLSKS